MSGKRENATPFGPIARLDEFVVAITFMTRLPLPFREAPLAAAAWAFPLAGALVGGLSGAVLWLALSAGIPMLVAAFLALSASALVTGALHEDGLADCADGFWGGSTPERRLAIMRDSRSGAYGVLALILATGIKAGLIAALAERWGGLPVWAMLIAVHAVARAGLPLAMAKLPLAGQSGKAGKIGLAATAGKPSILTAGSALLFGIGVTGLVLFGFPLTSAPNWMPFALIAGSLATVLLIGALARRKLGGVNGDTLGGMEQISEIVCLMIFATILGT